MHADAAYWSVLTGDGAPPGAAIVALVEALRTMGRWHVRDLFDQHPAILAGALARQGVDPAPPDALLPADQPAPAGEGTTAHPLETFAALQALRPALPAAARRLERLAATGVDLIARWDRGYPDTLPLLLGDAAPLALWFAGPPALARDHTVAILGSRSAGPTALACARAIATALARAGIPVLTGAAGSVGSAVIAAVLAEPAGRLVALLGQGMARALPDLRHLRPHLKEGRVLLISAAHPDAAWQPGMEALRNALAVALTTHLVLVAVDEQGGTWDLAQTALAAGHPLSVLADEEPARRLLHAGALPLRWPEASPDDLVADLSPPPRKSAPGLPIDASAMPSAVAADAQPPAPDAARARRRAAPRPRAVEPAPDQGDGAAHPQTPVACDPEGSAPSGDPRLFDLPGATGEQASPPRTRPRAAARARPRDTVRSRPGPLPEGLTLREAVLAHLRRHARSTVGVGALLQVCDVDEATLERVTRQLVADGSIIQRTGRRGVGYRIATPENTAPPVYQLSLFSQDD